MLLSIFIDVVKVIVVFAGFMIMIAYTTWFERRMVAFIQSRLGPNRVGPAGLLQPIADAFKLLFKEPFLPEKSNKVLFSLAPMIAFIPPILAVAVVPIGDTITIAGRKVELLISDLNIGILYVFALGSIGVYGLVLAGWSSNSKYSLLGGLRSSAQMISYEIGLGLSVVGLLMIAQTFSIAEIVRQQSGSVLNWYFFKQPVAFFLFFICAMAESNRLPFDLPEAESELVAGYHTEYPGMRFALFFLGEYAHMITVSMVTASLFFGGWSGPFLPPIVWFLIKVVAFLFIYVWVRGTLPRFRYDQLMRFGWLVIFPLTLVNILVTGLVMVL
ncbi:MAG: NADH-quinone oxidoreductase subunit H [candidate division Zixibacteria bacterium 4484_95]|nr:MAG: NADH-quinone oxidoreductase subunit H [candidate division Zixibacteria bacterium 4484_95]